MFYRPKDNSAFLYNSLLHGNKCIILSYNFSFCSKLITWIFSVYLKKKKLICLYDINLNILTIYVIKDWRIWIILKIKFINIYKSMLFNKIITCQKHTQNFIFMLIFLYNIYCIQNSYWIFFTNSIIFPMYFNQVATDIILASSLDASWCFQLTRFRKTLFNNYRYTDSKICEITRTWSPQFS